jgi:murein DD-endopeptidase MepM/ murein hydrolase activator NlpD
VVARVGYATGFEGYGNIVEIRHGRYEELYGHLSAYRVKVGQRVWAGEHIATAGCTGYCTGTHLHFEVRVNGVAVSPLGTVLRPLMVTRVIHVRRSLTASRPSFSRLLLRLE